MKKWYVTRKRKMKPFGKNLRWIEDRQYGEEYHTGMALPSSGKHRGKRRKRYLRPFKTAERMRIKADIRKEETTYE